MRTLQSLAIR